MRTLSIIVAATLGLAAATTPVMAIETIDCGRDGNAAERTICASQVLQVLDAKVTEAYADIMLDGHITGHVKRAVQESQFAFLKRRDACGRDFACLAEIMGQRASRIGFYR